MNRWTRIAVCLALAFALAAPALAKDDPPPGPGFGPGGENVRRRIQMYWMWRMTEELNLDEQTSQKLFQVVQKFEPQIRAARREQVEKMRELRQAADRGEKLTKDKVLAVFDQAMAADKKARDLRREQLVEVSRVLSPEQFHKFVLAQEKFMREMGQMVRDARGMRGGRGAGPLRGWNPPPDQDEGEDEGF